MLEHLGTQHGLLGLVFRKAQNKIQDPAKLKRLVSDLIDKEQWVMVGADRLDVLASVAGVTVGTAALVIALSLMTGFVEDVRQRIHSGSAHLTVMSLLGDRQFDDVEGLSRQVEAVPGISAAGPVLYTHAMLTREDIDSPAFCELEGIDPAAHARVTLDPGEPDPFPALEERGSTGRAGIVLGEELAMRLSVIQGEMVRVFVPRATLSPWGPARSVAIDARSDAFLCSAADLVNACATSSSPT